MRGRVEPKRYIFLKKRRATETRLLGVAMALILIGLPVELERGVAAEPDASEQAGWITTVEPAGSATTAETTAGAVTPKTPEAVAEATAPSRAEAIVPVSVHSASGYDDGVLQAFAASAYQMIVIRDRWRPVVERAAASGPEEAAKARHAEAAELVQAVHGQGLSATRYREIFNAAQKNPALKSYLLSLVRTVDTRTLPAD